MRVKEVRETRGRNTEREGGRKRAEITAMQFTGHSLPVHQSMAVAWDFTLSHFVSQARLRDFFP